jgi:hypothetical protein
VDRINKHHLHPLLSELVTMPYFRYFKVSSSLSCSLLATPTDNVGTRSSGGRAARVPPATAQQQWPAPTPRRIEHRPRPQAAA